MINPMKFYLISTKCWASVAIERLLSTIGDNHTSPTSPLCRGRLTTDIKFTIAVPESWHSQLEVGMFRYLSHSLWTTPDFCSHGTLTKCAESFSMWMKKSKYKWSLSSYEFCWIYPHAWDSRICMMIEYHILDLHLPRKNRLVFDIFKNHPHQSAI